MRVRREKGLVVCPLPSALPDPNWPDWYPNLKELKWCTMLNRKIVFAAPTKQEVMEWAQKLTHLTQLPLQQFPS